MYAVFGTEISRLEDIVAHLSAGGRNKNAIPPSGSGRKIEKVLLIGLQPVENLSVGREPLTGWSIPPRSFPQKKCR